MTIEFTCSHCDKPLSTSDDKAGRKARCPGCGEAVQVPTVNAAGIDLAEVALPSPTKAPATAAPHGYAQCPMCGHPVAATDKECSACGEPLSSAKRTAGGGSVGEPVAFDLGVVLTRSWEIFKQDLGLVVGGQIVAGLLGTAAMLPGGGMLIGAFVTGMEGGKDEMLPLLIVLGVFGFIFLVIGGLVALWLNVGAHMLLLGVVRGADVSFNTLFQGRKFLGRSFLCSFLYNIMEQIGQRLCILPGLLVFVFFWPFQYLIIDDDLPNIQALLEAPKLASKSALMSFVLMIVSVAVFLLGALALGVGLIFAVPFTSLLWCVAYDEMRGDDRDEDIDPLTDADEEDFDE